MEQAEMTTIGFVGLGAMGSRIAGRLLASGYQVYGTNRTEAKAEPLFEQGLIWRGTPRSAAPTLSLATAMWWPTVPAQERSRHE